MPRRTNTFQEVVAILHRHLAGDAEVVESAMLKNQVTGEDREVDVVIRSVLAGQEMVLAVEATKKKGSSPWVEEMIGKHEELPTDRLVLVSERGFSKPARRYAERKGVAVIEPEVLAEPDPAARIVGRLERVWPKGLALTASDLQILVRKPSGDLLAVKEVPPDGLIYLGDETRVNTHLGFFQEFFSTEFPRIAQLFGLYDIEEDREQAFLLRIGKPEQPLRIIARGREQDVYLRWELSPQPELHQVICMQYGGRAVINVAEVRLTHRRFNTTGVSYGESKIGGFDALVVATGNGSDEKVTLRLRGDETETEAAEAPPNGYTSASTDEADKAPHSDLPLDA